MLLFIRIQCHATAKFVSDEPSSPYSFVSCLRKDDFGYVYKCDSKDKATFYVEMTISIPQIPQNNTPNATVYIWGDHCNNQDVCPDLAALADSANNDKMSNYPDEGRDEPDQFLHDENDDNDLAQMPLKDTLTNVGSKTSRKDKDMRSPSIKKSSNNDDIKRSKSQRTQNSKKNLTKLNVSAEKQPVALTDLKHNEHSYDNFIHDYYIDVDRQPTIDRNSLINEKDAYSSNNEIYENSLKTNPRRFIINRQRGVSPPPDRPVKVQDVT
ncbi:4977_t:CDS:2, partial [Racocetra fulgida]